jgi:tetratricopeptide (TPR) repeat protein
MSQALPLSRPNRGWLSLAGAGGCLPLGRISGIPILLHWSWFLVAWAEVVYRARTYHSLGWNIAEYVALFGLVLLHELGHALACRSVGGRVDRIVLWPLGGIALINPPPRPGPFLWSIAAGPLVNLVLVLPTLGCYLVARWNGWDYLRPDAAHFLFALTAINLGLLIFNVLPVYPLDGGQLLYGVLWCFLGRGRGLQVACWLGLAGAAALGVLLLRWSPLWAAVLTLFLFLQAGLGLFLARLLRRPGWEHFFRANTYLRLGDHDLAIAECSLALANVGDDRATLAMAYQRRGVASLARGDHDRAVADLSRAVEVAPHAPLHFTRGLAHLVRGDCPAASADFSTALALDPRHARARFLRGDAHFQLGEHDQAREDLAQARALDPTLPRAYRPSEDSEVQKLRLDWAVASCDVFLRVVAVPGADACNEALAALKADNPEEALERCNAAVRLNPRLAVAYFLRGETLRQLGRPEEALPDLEKALSLDPVLSGAHACRGTIRRARQEYDQAIADFSEVLRLDPQLSQIYFERGQAYRAKGDLDRANADFTEALRLGHRAELVYPYRAAALRSQGRYAEAVADLQEVLRLKPRSTSARNSLAFLWATCPDDGVRDGRQALAYATEACELSHWKEAVILDTLAAAYAELGEFEQALRWQQAALEDPAFCRSFGERARLRLQLYREGKPFRE